MGLCTNPKFYKNSTVPIKAVPQNDVSQKKIFELTIEDSLLKKINAAEEQATIIVRFSDKKPSNESMNLVAIELMNNNKVLYLREGRPLEEKLV